MNYGIELLCHLVQTKNDINRKRRRFYAMIRSNTYGESNPHKSYTVDSAREGYIKAKAEMRAMTPAIKLACKEINAHLVWSDHGAIDCIDIGNLTLRPWQIKEYAELYQADEILLGK